MSDERKTDGDERKKHFEENVPPPRILKLALIAAAVIVIIAIIVYLKARHEPPALHDDLQPRAASPQKSEPGSMQSKYSRLREPLRSPEEVTSCKTPRTESSSTA